MRDTDHTLTSVTVPALMSARISRTWGTSGRRSSLRLLAATKTMTAMSNADRGEERLLGLLQGRDGLLAGNGREILELPSLVLEPVSDLKPSR